MLEKILSELKKAASGQTAEKYLEALAEYTEKIKVISDFPDELIEAEKKSNSQLFKRKKTLSEKQIQELKANKNIDYVVDGKIYFTKDFKIKAVRDYLLGKNPVQIFNDAGICIKELYCSNHSASTYICKWKNQFFGKNAKPDNKSLRERNKYLELENELLKKILFFAD